MNMKTIAFIFMMFVPGVIIAQVSIQQDNAGESSLVFGQNNAVLLNSSDASIGFNISQATAPANKHERFWLASAKVGASQGTSKIFNGTTFKPKFDVNVHRGYYLTSSSKSTSRYWYFGGGVKNEYFNLWADTNVVDLVAKDFFGYKATIGYNVLGAVRTFKYGDIFGVSISGGYFSNTGDLDGVTQYTVHSNLSSVILSDSKTGFIGPYSSSYMVKASMDYLVYALENIAIGSFYRGGFGGEFASQNMGFGIYFGHQDAPSKILTGIVYQVNDVFNQLGKENSFQKRSSLSLIAGYTF
jgi:hypothetical protein